MIVYAKPWLSVDEQVGKLVSRGVVVSDVAECRQLLKAVGYYRLTGYLHPFREFQGDGSTRYRTGTTIELATKLIDFDRRLRMITLDGIERVEVSLRMQVGYVMGRSSPFAHLDHASFITSFTTPLTDYVSAQTPHDQWLDRVERRRASSDEAFVVHFRDKYNNQMPIWALTEILEMGQLGRLYAGLNRSFATEIASTYSVPSKKMMSSWISSINYVRNVSAHHARLFNRKLVSAPARPSHSQMALLGHLKEQNTPKEVFGVYNVLAVLAYLLRSIDAGCDWASRVVELLKSFPTSADVTISSLGAPRDWSRLALWAGAPRPH